MRAFLAARVLGGLIALVPAALAAQDSTATPRAWYDRLTIRGYAQVRYNRLFETNEKLKCPTCDRSIGDNGGFILRRARLAITGEITDRITFAIQPDFASEVGGRENTLVLRHYYADIALDAAKTIRARIGQSEVPVGFEALQSSSRRGPLDRSDAMESAAPGEQDLGVFFFWTPRVARQRFRQLNTNRLKGAGEYGVVALGAYNGQGGNRAEANDAPHVVARVAYPFLVGKQFIEIDAHAFTGTYTITSAQRSAGVGGANDLRDKRAGASLIVYPQPVGLQAEWMVGRGPEYEAATNSIVSSPVRGGYALISYAFAGRGERGVTTYARAQYFKGAFKTDTDARSSVVHEYEPGVEWALGPGFKMTAAYAISHRRYRDSASRDNDQKGRFLRLQAQFSF